MVNGCTKWSTQMAHVSACLHRSTSARSCSTSMTLVVGGIPVGGGRVGAVAVVVVVVVVVVVAAAVVMEEKRVAAAGDADEG